MTTAGEQRPGPDEGPGAALQREREARGLDRQQVAEQLNLDLAVIYAIEQNDFPALGAPVFARGHLRRYAAFMGLDDGEVLVAYDRARHPEDPTLVPRAHLERLPERKPPRWPWTFGGLAAFAVAAGVVAYLANFGFGLPGGDRGNEAQPPVRLESIEAPAAGPWPTSATDTAESADTTAATTVTPADAVSAPTTTATPADPTAAAASGALKLEFRFVQDSWIEIFDGTGRAVLYDLGVAGSTRMLSAPGPLSVTIGNAPAVQLAVNGRPVPLPAPEAGQTVIRVRVDASGVLR
jgi:cytoskeleton protein RodZ